MFRSLKSHTLVCHSVYGSGVWAWISWALRKAANWASARAEHSPETRLGTDLLPTSHGALQLRVLVGCWAGP